MLLLFIIHCLHLFSPIISVPLSTFETATMPTIRMTSAESERSPASECGETPISPIESRIIGGEQARPFSWPWQAELCTIDPNTRSLCNLRCGASLIHREWVLTAAHCVEGYEYAPHLFRVKLGTFDVRRDSEDGSIVRNISRIKLHSMFRQPHEYSYDIALLKLSKPVVFTDHIQPVCIAKSVNNLVKEGMLAYVTGWGASSPGGLVSSRLRQVRVPFLSMDHCRAEYSNNIDESMECAGKLGFDSCQGDSGGPLVTKHENGRWYQVGVVSWGQGCAEENHAGVYSRPSAACDFIREFIGEDLCID